MKKVLLASVILCGLMTGCQNQIKEEPYIAKYTIDKNEKSLNIEFSKYFKGNKTVVCKQLEEILNIENYQCNIN